MTEYRTEHDSMGELQVPADALWGAQTQRAVQNFPISGIPMPREFIRALGLIKAAAAQVNQDMGFLDEEKAAAIKGRCRAKLKQGKPMSISPSTCFRPVRALHPI